MTLGKQFENDFSSSAPLWTFIYRLRDSAASFSPSSKTRFTPSNICDFILFDDITRTLFLLELKTIKGASIPLTNIRQNQIKELTKAAEHNLIAGFIVNFREKDNFTAFLSIKNFNTMMKNLNKKSFNIEDMKKYGCIEIQNEKKKVHYRYDISDFIQKLNNKKVKKEKKL